MSEAKRHKELKDVKIIIVDSAKFSSVVARKLAEETGSIVIIGDPSGIDSLETKLKDSFFQHLSGENNDWRIKRNWKSFYSQFIDLFS